MTEPSASRLAATPQTSASARRAETPCLECGKPFTRSKRAAEFCATGCRKTWNNRRMKRGAQLYDLFLAMRYEREAATEQGAWALLCRLAQSYNDEDQAERGGRRSWQRLKAAIAQLVHLKATVVSRPK